MNIRKMSFNRNLQYRDLWKLRNIFFIIVARVCKPKITMNLLRFLYSSIFKNIRVSNMPIYAMLESSSQCNFSCKMCWRTLYKVNRAECNMPYDNFRNIIDKVGDYLIFVALWNYGEPLLNPDLARMVEYCSAKGIITVLSTNGSLLNREKSLALFNCGLKYLIICIDGISEDVYQKYRAADKLSEVENNLRWACGIKKKTKSKFPVIELQFIVMKENEHQVKDFLTLARSWGVDRVSLKRFSALRDSGLPGGFLPQNNDYVLDCYKKTGYVPKDFCSVPWQGLVINSDGGVVPCCSDYFSNQKLGNISEEDVSQIWNNARYIEFRRQVKHDINSVGICRDCPHDSGQVGSFISTRQF